MNKLHFAFMALMLTLSGCSDMHIFDKEISLGGESHIYTAGYKQVVRAVRKAIRAAGLELASEKSDGRGRVFYAQKAKPTFGASEKLSVSVMPEESDIVVSIDSNAFTEKLFTAISHQLNKDHASEDADKQRP